jgi:hypothetical protein
MSQIEGGFAMYEEDEATPDTKESIDKQNEKAIKEFLKGEEEIDEDGVSCQDAFNEFYESAWKSVYIRLGIYEMDYPQAYNKDASRSLITCFQARKLNLNLIIKLLEAGMMYDVQCV